METFVNLTKGETDSVFSKFRRAISGDQKRRGAKSEDCIKPCAREEKEGIINQREEGHEVDLEGIVIFYLFTPVIFSRLAFEPFTY